MIWFFLMGMIGGATGMMLLAHWWVHTHVKQMSKDEFIEEAKKIGEEETHE